VSERVKEAGFGDAQTILTRLPQQDENLASLYQTLRDEFQRYREVNTIAQRLRQSLCPDDVLEQAVDAAQQLLSVDRVVIYRFDQPSHAVSHPNPPKGLAQIPDKIGDITPELMAFYQQVSPLVINDLQKTILPPELAEHVQQQQARALLIAPILREQELLGIICAHHYQRSRHWQLQEVESLQQLATEVAIALHQSELHQRTEKLNSQVQERTTELQTALSFESLLKRITDKVRDSLDENQILQAAVLELTVGLGLGSCNASVYDLQQGTSTIHHEYVHSGANKRKVSQMEDFPEIYEQLKHGLYFQFCSLLPNPDRGRTALLACPIFVDAQTAQSVDQSAVLGDLWLVHSDDHIFDDFEIRLVQQVANQCAIAIRQARLYQAAQTQVTELEKLNRLKDEFLSTVSHELRTPIANLKMAIHMLKIAPTDDRRQKYLEILEKESAREADLINDLLDLQRLESGSSPVNLEEIPLVTWIKSMVEPFHSRLQDQKQDLQVNFSAAEIAISSDTTLLRRVLLELLNNACKYTAPGGKIQMKVDATPGAAHIPSVLFVVKNEAHIAPTELTKIFDKFYRCPNADPWSRGGTGLGLALVQKLVGQLQGEIHVDSQDGWTTFTVTLPQRYKTTET
jgi:signal transduction histidine kinase